MGEIVKPSFSTTDFVFDGPVPLHNDVRPLNDCTGTSGFAIFLSDPYPPRTYPIACNVPDRDMLQLLVDARLAITVFRARASGLSEDVLVWDADADKYECVYEGWWPDNAPYRRDTIYLLHA